MRLISKYEDWKYNGEGSPELETVIRFHPLIRPLMVLLALPVAVLIAACLGALGLFASLSFLFELVTKGEVRYS